MERRLVQLGELGWQSDVAKFTSFQQEITAKMIECIDKTIGGVWEMVLGRKPTPEDKGRLQLVDIPGDYETRRVFFDELEIGYLKSGFDGNIFRSTFKPLHHWIR